MGFHFNFFCKVYLGYLLIKNYSNKLLILIFFVLLCYWFTLRDNSIIEICWQEEGSLVKDGLIAISLLIIKKVAL